MAKYHITAKGEPGVCRATKTCPLGSAEDHYGSKEEARQAFEERQETEALLEGIRKSPDFVEFRVVPKEELMRPDQKAHRIGDYFVSTLPVPSIGAKGNVETLYETMVIDKNGEEVKTWSTRDTDSNVHDAQHLEAISYTVDLAQNPPAMSEEKAARIMATPEYAELLEEANEVAEEDDPGSASERNLTKNVEAFAEKHGVTSDDVMDMFAGSNWKV